MTQNPQIEVKALAAAGKAYVSFAHQVSMEGLSRAIRAYLASQEAAAPSEEPVAWQALREAKTLLADLRLGQSIQNDRFPDRKIEGPLWDKIGSAVARCDAALASPPISDGELRFRLSSAGVDPLEIGYTNWRGEYAIRKIIPRSIWYGSTEWHPEPQWLITAHDVEKGADRDFAMSGFDSPAVAPVAVSVKGLEWRANPLMNWVAPSIVGQYFVFKDAGDSTWAMAVPDAVAAGEFKTADLAKAAAQSDFNARILSSIIPATKGGEALRKLIYDALDLSEELRNECADAVLAALAQDTDGVAPTPDEPDDTLNDIALENEIARDDEYVSGPGDDE